MRVRWMVGLRSITCVVILTGFSSAEGQGLTATGAAQPLFPSAATPGSSVLNNPVFNPLLNPNPPQTYDAQAMALFFLAAQRSRGGIGSGQLSGLQSATVTGRHRSLGRPPAEMPRSSTIPGGGAAGYFGRGQGGGSSIAPYYQRQNRHFSNNGR